MKSHVPGITCMTPRALAEETMALLKPDSCHAIAVASEEGTPWLAAICWIVGASTRVLVGTGAAAGTIVLAGAGAAARTGAGAPVGSFSTVPSSRIPFASRPFISAIASTETPERAASAPSVSPQRTL